MRYRFLLLLICILMSGCASQLQPKQPNKAICNELKHRIIFNGATNDPQVMIEQRAELGELNKNYREAGC